MTPDDVLAHYHTQAAAADAIGKNRQTVHEWVKAGKFPTDAQIAWEVESAGVLKADLPPEVRSADRRRASA